MSAEPLTPQNTTIIVACMHANQATDAMSKYGPQVAAQVTMVVCTTIAQAHDAATAHPSNTPWTILSGARPDVVRRLQDRFGPAKGFSFAIDARNNEKAIHPRLLRI